MQVPYSLVWNSDIRIKRETVLPWKTLISWSRFFGYEFLSVFGIDLLSVNIEFFCDIVNRHVGQHEDFMGWKNPEVLVHKDNQFISIVLTTTAFKGMGS